MAEAFAPPLAGFHGQAPPAPAWFSQALADAPERQWLKVQGAPIEWLAWGRVGDPGLLLLHGNGAHADWYSFIAPLVRAGRRVAALSFSGMGRSGWRTQYAMSQWADEALAVAQAAGLFAAGRPPVVVGHSFGGFVLMNLAGRHGQHLAKAVVVDTPIRPPGPHGGHAGRPRGRDVGRGGRTYASLAQALQRFRLLPPQACAHPFIAHHIAWHGLKQVAGPDGQPGWTWRFDPAVFQHFQFGSPFRLAMAAPCPLVLVRGGRSRLVPPHWYPTAMQRLQQLPQGCTLDEVADADHHVMVDQPQAFVALLERHAPAG